MARELQGQYGHAEELVLIAGIHASQTHEVFVRQVQPLAQPTQVLLDQRGWKPVVPGGHRRVRGEDGYSRHLAHHLAEGQARLFHHRADHLDRGEGAVALVEVKHRGINSQSVEGTYSADAQKQLLADAHPCVAAIEPRRQCPVRFAVLRHVRV